MNESIKNTTLQKDNSRQAAAVIGSKGKVHSDNRPLIQKKANNTGLPDNLKSGIENLSGHAMDDVKVHYNSDKPAQLNAHAYAQGSEIHLASGQEKHLPHEAWHVVQQKQGRVKPTMQMKGKVNVNDDKGLEKEADVMGAKALQTKPKENSLKSQNKNYSVDQKSLRNNSNKPNQLKSLIIQKVKAKKAKAKKAHGHKIDLKKQTMTVRNKKDSYTSGLINGLSQATGVEDGPRAEAQKVKKFFGGSWIGGHMVNDQLGGSGSFKNIVPITSSMNGLHKSVENQANNLLSAGNGTQIEYKMKILKRATVKNAVKTVKNLPIEFKQTLHVHPVGLPMYTINGLILQEAYPGNGIIQP
ncbi:DUF4157 domain-containing protein [Flavobacterium piscis]|uniref:DUF4157 domain-containing protein n=1 Tax=Flavobacterium piscis TaxID=1114874 RepID=A0ABU1YA30_9FLAO|nr:DUF4157 domain-containing protein [Flavobacterium piscis]MDR7211099.1 hypothetical protein [Flavobacterium piscis]